MQATITNTANKAIQESKRQAKLYNARLANQTSNQTDGEPATQNPDEYNRQLVIPPSDVMATINYPKLGISYPYATEQANRRSPSAQGIGKAHPCQSGEREPMTVITAHRGLADKLMFTKLDQAREGENSPSPPSRNPHLLKCKQSAHSPRPIHLNNEQRRQRRSATLMTCTPYGINTHRLLITGTRVPNHDECPPETGCLTDGTLSTTHSRSQPSGRPSPHSHGIATMKMHDRRKYSSCATDAPHTISQDDCKAKSTFPSTSSAGGRPTKALMNSPKSTIGRKSRTSPNHNDELAQPAYKGA